MQKSQSDASVFPPSRMVRDHIIAIAIWTVSFAFLLIWSIFYIDSTKFIQPTRKTNVRFEDVRHRPLPIFQRSP